MSKLEVYPRYSEYLKAAYVAIPETKENLQKCVFESLLSAAEEIGYASLVSEVQEEDFLDVPMDVLKITFRTVDELRLFKQFAQENYGE